MNREKRLLTCWVVLEGTNLGSSAVAAGCLLPSPRTLSSWGGFSRLSMGSAELCSDGLIFERRRSALSRMSFTVGTESSMKIAEKWLQW